MKRHHLIAILLLLLAVGGSIPASIDFLSMYRPDTIHPNETLTRAGFISDYHPPLKNTRGDTKVYFFDSAQPGSTLLVLGGTHPNESAGFITAVLLVESARVRQGRLIVIPQASQSGFTCTDPLEGYPESFSFTTPSGTRSFRFGSRGFNILDQWPDPLVYLQYPSGQKLSGVETRNLNRAYPGRLHGTLTEQVGFALLELMKREHVDIAFDLHEAAPEIPIINAIVAHEKGEEIAGAAVLNLQFENLEFALELSPKNFYGLSHREWGDRTDAYPFLMETSNPIQGRLRGPTSEGLIVDGVDERYREAAQLGTMRISYNLDGQPLSLRVGRHLAGLQAVVRAYNERFISKPVILENLPSCEGVVERGVGAFLH